MICWWAEENEVHQQLLSAPPTALRSWRPTRATRPDGSQKSSTRSGGRKRSSVIPDGVPYYSLRGNTGAMLRAFVEVDRATMGPERLAAKLTAYARLYAFVPQPAGRRPGSHGIQRTSTSESRVASTARRQSKPTASQLELWALLCLAGTNGRVVHSPPGNRSVHQGRQRESSSASWASSRP
ncbi:replication-relaxation family protein [Streptomyces sp. NPDC059582]|uniref:replication-relaxation family protein n=1 Tax=Streptomyces sp. NPDC059582 TaxID=3346875 RepID=UPI0036BD9195